MPKDTPDMLLIKDGAIALTYENLEIATQIAERLSESSLHVDDIAYWREVAERLATVTLCVP